MKKIRGTALADYRGFTIYHMDPDFRPDEQRKRIAISGFINHSMYLTVGAAKRAIDLIIKRSEKHKN